jgi:hypothetical protein
MRHLLNTLSINHYLLTVKFKSNPYHSILSQSNPTGIFTLDSMESILTLSLYSHFSIKRYIPSNFLVKILYSFLCSKIHSACSVSLKSSNDSQQIFTILHNMSIDTVHEQSSSLFHMYIVSIYLVQKTGLCLPQ